MKQALSISIACCALSLLTGCGSKTLLVTSGNENLRALSKITDNPESNAISVGGAFDDQSIVIAMTEKDNKEYSNIYRKENPLSPAIVQLTTGNNVNNAPSYCPSENRVAFSKFTAGGTSFDIYMVPASKGGMLIPITETSDYNEFYPTISADGELLAYQKSLKSPNLSHETNSEIWVKNLKTNENMMIGKGMYPAISPDGDKVAYVKPEGRSEWHLWVMNIDGTDARQLTSGKKETVQYPCWSPDGTRIAYSAYVNGNKKDHDIYVINEDGTSLRQLTNNESTDYYPFWSSEGMIYFISDRGGKSGKTQVWRFKYE